MPHRLSHPYHKGHGDELSSSHHRQQPGDHFPATLPSSSSAYQDRDVRDQTRQLQHNAQIHEKACAPPHRAEAVIIAMALRELCALPFPRDGRASFVQAVCDADGVVIGGRRVGDPVGEGNGGDRAGDGAKKYPE